MNSPNHAKLHAELQQLLGRIGDLVGLLCGAELATRLMPLRVHPSAKLWPYKGEQLTLAQLAALARIKPTAMRERLLRLSPEAAVAQGMSKFQPGEQRTWLLGGKPMTVADLAERAGVSRDTMRQRLRRHPPEVAVSFGRMPRGIQAFPRRAKGPRKAEAAASPRITAAPTPAPTQAPTPAPTAAPRRAIRITPTEQLLAIPPTPTRPPTPAPIAPGVIEPPGVKRTVAKAPPGRFEVQHAPKIFGDRIGRYEDTGSAVARQYGSKR